MRPPAIDWWLAVLEKLAAAFPAVPGYRSDLASIHNKLVILSADLGKGTEAEEQYRKGLDLLEKLAADFPAMPGYRISLGGNCCKVGIQFGDRGQVAESLGWFEKAIATLGRVHEAEPLNVMAKNFLRNSHKIRAQALDLCQNFAEASEYWDKAIALNSPEKNGRFAWTGPYGG